MNRLSVLIPVYNAENTITLLCNSLVALYARKYDLEVVLVNDCSTDSSDAACKKLQEEYPQVITYVKLSRNFGEHAALMAGLHYVTGDYCVMMDDDLQNPPEEIEKLLDEVRKGFDVVYTYYPERKDSLFRKIGSSFNDLIATLLLGKPRSLYLSSFKAVNRFLVNEIMKHDVPNPYIDGIIVKTTSNIGKVMVLHRERSYNRSGYTLGKLISLWGNMVVNFSLIPMRMAGIAGGMLIVSSLVYALYKAYDDIHTKGTLSDYEQLMSANLMFRGITLVAISVLGEYVGRIYLLLNKNPQYVVRELLASRKKPRAVEYLRTPGKKD
ncbi:MAG: glycosyltransferase family 2 protein [Nitrospiraceae bacterium]|nr:glycosyltransferase family 2 protein [Nitrospiraceae bacterium]